MAAQSAIHIESIAAADLERYARVPIRFVVESILRVEPLGSPIGGPGAGLGGLRLAEEPVETPYVKDYDALGELPTDWPSMFDVSNWAFFLALAGPPTAKGFTELGAAAVAFNTAGVNMLEGRSDLAVLWDLRVHPDRRGQGVGRALFQHAAAWARARGCRQLKVETQNVNVRACRFYAAQGCELGAIHRYGYAHCPPVAHEAMLLWYLEL